MKNYFKLDALFYLAATALGIIFINIIANNYFFRIDLTEDHRYTISPASKEVLKSLDDQIDIEVFLDGEFPPMYKRLQKSVQETLNEFKIYGGKNIQFKFTDPSAETDPNKKNKALSQIVRKGIQPTQLTSKDGDAETNKVIFPGALVSYGSREIPVMLLKGNRGEGEEQMVNQSIENIEYELITAIKEIITMDKKKVALLYGHGELDSLRTLDILKELSDFYDIKKVNIKSVENLSKYEAIIVAKPTQKYDDESKLKIDQFVVNGGKALFFVDIVNIHLDSIKENGSLAYPYDLNLEDLFFHWGIRFNQDLVQDVSCSRIAVNVGNVGNQPKFVLMPWRFNPLLMAFAPNNPIVKNMDAIQCTFAGTIDTVKAKGIQKTPLAFTSRYTKVVGAPVEISLNEMRNKPKQEDFKKKNQMVACLLEGKFTSSYASRPLYREKYPDIASQNKDSKILVFADGDIISNDFDPIKQQIIPVGMNKYTLEKYANRDFVVNALNYMLDNKGLINIRNKKISLRPLDRIKIEKEKEKWQFINVVLPIILVLALGFLKYHLRKKKFENMGKS